jgi:hypothetical protein
LFEIAKMHSIKTKDADEIIDQIIDKFSEFKARALKLGMDKKFVDEIDRALRIKL